MIISSRIDTHLDNNNSKSQSREILVLQLICKLKISQDQIFAVNFFVLERYH